MTNLTQRYSAINLEETLNKNETRGNYILIESGINDIDNQETGVGFSFRICTDSDVTVLDLNSMVVSRAEDELDILIIDARFDLEHWILDKLSNKIISAKDKDIKIDAIEFEFRLPPTDEEKEKGSKGKVDTRIHYYEPELIVSIFRATTTSTCDLRFVVDVSNASIHHRLKR